MKLIKPAEISAKIMTLIDEAEKELIIVSPYNDIADWTKLTNRIKKAQANGVLISWYSRKNNVDRKNSDEVRSVGIEPILIYDLHAKIYFNEETAIFTSMNMSQVSDNKSIDLGYITENKTEYDELYSAFKKHIKGKSVSNKVKEKNENIPSNPVSSRAKPQGIKTDEYYVKIIHEHILKNYGSYSYSYKKGDSLEYYEFIKPGFKIQFLPYSRAIKTHIYFPTSGALDNVEQEINRNNEYKKFIGESEYEFVFGDQQNYIKFYFEKKYCNINSWNEDIMNEFLENVDFLVKISYK